VDELPPRLHQLQFNQRPPGRGAQPVLLAGSGQHGAGFCVLDRWFNRKVAWDMAERALGHVQANDTPQLRETIVDLALAKGFWSVWMTVFRNDANMLGRFITAFPGTDAACFDVLTLQPVPRTGGAI
jgi:hypothetical protein